MKTYADNRRHAITSNFRVRDQVIYHQLNSKINNKYKNQFSNIPYIIKAVKGSMITVIDSNNNELTRNSSCFKHVSSNLKLNYNNDEIDEIPTSVITSNNFISQNPQLQNIETILQNNNIINNNPQQQQPTVMTTTGNNNKTNDNQQPTITINNNNKNSNIQTITRPVRESRNKFPQRFNDYIITRK